MENHMARILVVDDEEMDRVLEQAILESAGHELLFASDGATALAICEKEDIELIITDLVMPDFNGLRFIKELRESNHFIPLIAVSGWAVDQLDLAQQYGADMVLTKPVEGDGLLKAVDEALGIEGVPKRMDPWVRVRR
jgi:two-component system capsular synthesis sensor histidine kinase RcsC